MSFGTWLAGLLGIGDPECEALEHDYQREERLSTEAWRVECSVCGSVAVDVVKADPVEETVEYLRLPVETGRDGEPLLLTGEDLLEDVDDVGE